MIVFGSCKKVSVQEIELPNGFIENDWQAAVDAAQTHDKNIFLHLYADWCTHCANFKADVLNDTEVEEYMFSNFIGSALDTEQQQGIDIVNQYNLQGHPHFAVISKDAVLVGNHLGVLSKEDFLTWIEDYE